MTSVFVGIASNVDPLANIDQAIEALARAFGPVELSPAYRSRAVGFEGNDFVNLVAQFETRESLPGVLRELLRTELRLGKDPSGPRFSPKVIDLDLLLFGDIVVDHDRLCLPRPEILTQAYYLQPIADLAPEREHPLARQTYAALSRGVDTGHLECVRPGERRDSVAGLESELHVKDLVVAVHLGVPDDERRTRQDVSVSFDVSFDVPPDACGNDAIAGTVDYGILCEEVTSTLGSREFKTIEHLAQTCFDAIVNLLLASGEAVGAMEDPRDPREPRDPQGLQLAVTVLKKPPIANLRGGAEFALRGRVRGVR